MADFIGGGISVPIVTSTEPHTTAEELPPPVKTVEPPASNPGVDDPTGGIPKEAGGLSNTAGIGSPVASEPPKTVVGSVLASVFGTKEKERTAEEVDAAAPTTATVTTDATTAQDTGSSGTYLGAVGAIATGAAAAGGAAVASIIPGRASTTHTEGAPVTSEKTLGEQTAEATESAKATAVDTIESAKATASDAVESAKATTADAVESAKNTTSDAVESAKATTSDAVESAKANTSDTVESAKATTSNAVDSAKATTSDAVESAKATSSEVAGSAKATTNEAVDSAKDAAATAGDKAETSTKPKEVSDHEAAIRENKDAIPTAGGERLGAAHEGESKVIPANPAPQDAEPGIASAAGQPDSTTAENTAKNAGEGTPSSVSGSKKDGDLAKSDKPKFFSRLKNKLARKDKA